MRKIKILEVVDSIQYGGVEMVLYNLLNNIDLSKYDISIATMGKRYEDAEKRFTNLNIKIYSLPARRKKFFSYIFGLKKIIERGSFDIVHSHNDYWGFIPLFLAKKKKISKRISHFHCKMNSSFKIKILSFFTSKMSTVKLACSDIVGKCAYGKCKYIVLNNGLIVNNYIFSNKTRKIIRDKYHLKSNTIVLGHVGRFDPIKNHSFIIKLFNEYHKNNSNSKLMLVGDGPARNAISRLVNEFHLENDVIFTGNVSNVCDFYQAFDAFVFPSINEGFGIAVLEAQYSGLKCIVSNTLSSEIRLIDSVDFLPIDNINPWVEMLKTIDYSYNRNLPISIINNSKFDIIKSANLLETIYTDKNKGDFYEK